MIGEKIRELRKKHRYSQRQLADMLGVAQTAVSGWETGARGISLDVVMQIAALLGEPTSAFLPEQTDTQVKEKLDSVKHLDSSTVGELIGLHSEGDIWDVFDRVEGEAITTVLEIEDKSVAFMKKQLRGVSDKALMRLIVEAAKGLNKLGKYELLQRAFQLQDDSERYAGGSEDAAQDEP